MQPLNIPQSWKLAQRETHKRAELELQNELICAQKRSTTHNKMNYF